MRPRCSDEIDGDRVKGVRRVRWRGGLTLSANDGSCHSTKLSCWRFCGRPTKPPWVYTQNPARSL